MINYRKVHDEIVKKGKIEGWTEQEIEDEVTLALSQEEYELGLRTEEDEHGWPRPC